MELTHPIRGKIVSWKPVCHWICMFLYWVNPALCHQETVVAVAIEHYQYNYYAGRHLLVHIDVLVKSILQIMVGADKSYASDYL